MKIPVRRVQWKPCWRIIPTRYPEKNIYDRVADPRDVEAVIQLERMTNDRYRNEAGAISVFDPKERVSGPGSQFIMASFLNAHASRFSDGNHGVYYAAREFATAVAETKYHTEQFMRATQQKPTRLGRRVLLANVEGNLHDLRRLKSQRPSVYSKTSYAASQALAEELRKESSSGIVWDSVRREGGQCVAVFRPILLSHCRRERYLEYEWDGKRIAAIYELHEFPI